MKPLRWETIDTEAGPVEAATRGRLRAYVFPDGTWSIWARGRGNRPRRELRRSDHRTRGTDQKLGMGAVAAYMDAHFLWD